MREFLTVLWFATMYFDFIEYYLVDKVQVQNVACTILSHENCNKRSIHSSSTFSRSYFVSVHHLYLSFWCSGDNHFDMMSGVWLWHIAHRKMLQKKQIKQKRWSENAYLHNSFGYVTAIIGAVQKKHLQHLFHSLSFIHVFINKILFM